MSGVEESLTSLPLVAVAPSQVKPLGQDAHHAPSRT